jgi:hypothetical protein
VELFAYNHIYRLPLHFVLSSNLENGLEFIRKRNVNYNEEAAEKSSVTERRNGELG